MKKLHRLFFILAVGIFLVSCGAKEPEDTRTDFQKIEVPERKTFSYDENEPYFHGKGSEEEFKILEKVKNTNLTVNINGQEFNYPIPLDEFYSRFDIIDRADRGTGRAELLASDGTSYYVYINGDEVTGFYFNGDYKPEYDIVMPFGILPEENYEDVLAKIDEDLLVPRYESESVDLNNIIPGLDSTGGSDFRTRNFIFKDKDVKLNFSDFKLITMECGEAEKSLTGFSVSEIYYGKTGSEASADAEVTLNGKTFKMPLTMGEIISQTGGTLQEYNVDNYKDYSFYSYDGDTPDEYDLKENIILDIDGVGYKIRHVNPGSGYEYTDESRVGDITFGTDKPFSIKNSKFELNNENILEIINLLEANNVPYKADHFADILYSVEFYFDDNTKFSIRDDKIKIENRSREYRMREEGDYKKEMGIL